MKIRDDLVYSNSCNRLHGYINLGDVNDQLELEKCASNNKPHELIEPDANCMIRGIFLEVNRNTICYICTIPSKFNALVLHLNAAVNA